MNVPEPEFKPVPDSVRRSLRHLGGVAWNDMMCVAASNPAGDKPLPYICLGNQNVGRGFTPRRHHDIGRGRTPERGITARSPNEE